MDFFDNPKNKKCWGGCGDADECQGSVKPVSVYSDSNPALFNTGTDGLPFFYCDEAIRADENRGFRVEVVRR